MFMAPKHYKLPLCIYLCCVWPAMSLCSRTGFSVPCLLMNTNYTPVSLPLNVSLLYPTLPPLLAELRAPRSDLLQWISVVLWNALVSSFALKVNTVRTEKNQQTRVGAVMELSSVTLQKIPRCALRDMTCWTLKVLLGSASQRSHDWWGRWTHIVSNCLLLSDPF